MAETLLISLQGIGNALLALTAAKSLHLAGEQVTLLALSPRLASVMYHVPTVHRFIAAGSPKFAGTRGRVRLIRELRQTKFDRAVFSFPSGSRAYLLARLAGIPVRIGHRYPELGRGVRYLTETHDPVRAGHDIDQNLQILASHGLEARPAELFPPLQIPNELAEAGRRYLVENGLDPQGRYVGLHTGCDGAWVEKRWPDSHFAALAEMVYEKYRLPAIVFDGPAEPGSGLRVKRAAKTPVHALCGWGNLGDAWGLMASCAMFVGNDSGLMNLASVSGLPTVSVFGPSQPHRTRPYGPQGRAVISDRTCAPCFGLGDYDGCPYENLHCMPGIAPQRVMAAIDELLTV